MRTRIIPLTIALMFVIGGAAFAQACGVTSGGASTVSAAANTDIAAGSDATHDIVGAITNNGSLSVFIQMLNGVDLTSILQGTGPFTVFAPNDNAFGACSEVDQNAMSDKTMLTSVLKYHVITGKKLTTADLQKDNGKKLKSLNGMDLPVSVKDGQVSVGTAHLVGSEIPTSNGVIHIVDTVIMPTMPATDMKQ